MSKTAFGKISGVPWSTTAESAWDIIVENWRMEDQGNVQTLSNESGDIQLHVRDEEYKEYTFEATIKGANHWGENDMRGAVITTMSDTTINVPLIVTANGKSVQRREFQKCSMTARFYGTDFTTGTLPSTFTTMTTTTGG